MGGRHRQLADDDRVIHLDEALEAVLRDPEGRRRIPGPQLDLCAERVVVDDVLGVGDPGRLGLGDVEVLPRPGEVAGEE
jgi:hypothetical protein